MLLTAILTFCAVFTSLGLMFNILLGPVKESQASLEKRMDRMETSINNKIDHINLKLDKILTNGASAIRR